MSFLALTYYAVGAFYTPPQKKYKKIDFFRIFPLFFLWSQPHFYIFALTVYHVIFLQSA